MVQKKYKRVVNMSKNVPNVLSQKIAAADDRDGNSEFHEVTLAPQRLPLRSVYKCHGGVSVKRKWKSR